MVGNGFLQGLINGIKDVIEVLIEGEENPGRYLSERSVELRELSRLLGVTVEIPLYPIFIQTPTGKALGNALVERSEEEGENLKIGKIEIALFTLFCGERVLNGILAREFAVMLAVPNETEIPYLLSQIMDGPTEEKTLDPTSGEAVLAYEQLHDLLPDLTLNQN